MACTLLVAGCLETETNRCADLICPKDTVCVPTLGQCYTEDAVDVCRGRADGDVCTGVGIVEGHCRLGVCVDTECGDNVVSGSEDCEGEQMGSATCESLDFYGGSLSCGIDCKYNTTECVGYCGDGVKNGPEECDAGDLPAGSCMEFGFDGGALSCSSICSTSFSTCERFGWSIRESGTGAYIEEMWGTSPSDLYAVGRGGDFRHFDGSDWSVIQLQAASSWRAIDGSAADHAWAVGAAGQVARFDGSEWTLVDAGTMENLYDVHVRDTDDVIIVGANNTVLTYDGSGFSSMDIGADPGGRLKAVASNGSLLAIAGRDDNYDGVLHLYDGANWQTLPGLNYGPIKSVVLVAADDVWITQKFGQLSRWDGNGWNLINLPGVSTCHDILYRAVDDVFVACGGSSMGRPIYHYNGFSWTALEWDHFGAARSIVELGGTLYAGGARGALATFGGKGYVKHTVPTGLSFTNVAAVDRSAVFASHTQGVARFNGTAWTNDDLGQYVRAVVAFAPDNALALPNVVGTVRRWNGSAWANESLPPPLDTNIAFYVDATSSDNIWVMNSSRMLAHYNGTSWTGHSVTMPSSSVSLATFGPSETWAGGYSGGLLRWDGDSWTEDPTFTAISGGHVRALGGRSSDDLYAGTDAGLYHRTAAGWEKVEGMPEGNAFYQWIEARGDDIYLAVNVGFDRVYRFDGANWTRVRTRTLSTTRASLADGMFVISDNTDVDILLDIE